MKKIFIILFLLFLIFLNIDISFWFRDIDSYLQGTKLVDASWDMNIEAWVKEKIIFWTKNIGWALALIAVFAISYWALMMSFSGGEEDKLKKAKDIIKWAILGFAWVVLAWSIIAIIVNFMYTF